MRNFRLSAGISFLLLIGLVLIPVVAMGAVINWSETASGTIDQEQSDHSYGSWGVFRNLYGWDRAISMWQEFEAGMDGDLIGVSLWMMSGSIHDSGSFDLKIYEGEGVDGILLETTSYSWTQDPDDPSDWWYTFELDDPVTIYASSHYTFCIEDLNANDAIRFRVSAADNPYPSGSYMHQGYQMPGGDYHTGANAANSRDSAFRTILSGGGGAIPEPAAASLFFMALLLLVRTRSRFVRA